MEAHLSSPRNSVNSMNLGNLTNHLTMNKSKFNDLVSHMCLGGLVVASLSLARKVIGSNPFTVMTNIFVTEFSGNIISVLIDNMLGKCCYLKFSIILWV